MMKVLPGGYVKASWIIYIRWVWKDPSWNQMKKTYGVVESLIVVPGEMAQ